MDKQSNGQHEHQHCIDGHDWFMLGSKKMGVNGSDHQHGKQGGGINAVFRCPKGRKHERSARSFQSGDCIHSPERIAVFGPVLVPLFAVTMEDSVICEMDSGQFRKSITEKPELALKYIEIVTARLQETEDMLEYMAYGSVRKRLLYLFNKLVSKLNPSASNEEWIPISVQITHQELASMTGSIRETVTPILNQLAEEGILRREGARKPYSIHRSRLQAALSESK